MAKKKRLGVLLSLPVQLVLVFIGIMLFGGCLSDGVKQFLYAGSLTIREVLLFVLPAIIFSYILSCILSLKRGALLFIGLLLGGICLSNFISTWVAYGVGSIVLKKVTVGLGMGCGGGKTLLPLWTIKIGKPFWYTNGKALFSGMVCAVVFSVFRVRMVGEIAEKMKGMCDFFLRRLFIPVVPFFVCGFIVKLEHEGMLWSICKQYGPIFLVILVTEVVYILFLFMVAAGFNYGELMRYLKNVVPSIVTGFSTMSSVATMPLTLQGAERNTHDKEKVGVIIPATVNVHLIGDSIAIPVVALAVIMTMGGGMPGIWPYLMFSIYFVFAKFAVAAVPGGGILVMVPILESQLGMNGEMTSLVTAIYVLIDGLTTVTNVTGNGAFAIIFTKVYGWFRKG